MRTQNEKSFTELHQNLQEIYLIIVLLNWLLFFTFHLVFLKNFINIFFIKLRVLNNAIQTFRKFRRDRKKTLFNMISTFLFPFNFRSRTTSGLAPYSFLSSCDIPSPVRWSRWSPANQCARRWRRDAPSSSRDWKMTRQQETRPSCVKVRKIERLLLVIH